MKIYLAMIIAVLGLNLAACTSPEEREAEANAELTEEKTRTIKEYKKCVKYADGDKEKLKQCDAILKAVEAVDGKK